MAFTAFPIMWFATMDYQYKRDELLANTKHYEIGLKDKCFGTKVFWQWLGLGALKALMLTWICFYVQENALRPDGGLTSLYPSGCVVYLGVVLIANHKLLINSNIYHVLGIVLFILSVASFFAILAIENLEFFGFDSVIGIFAPTMVHPMTWLGVFFALWVNYALEKIFELIGDYFDSREDQFKYNVVEITGYAPLGGGEGLSRDSSRSSTRRNLEEQGRTGFAYAEENNPNPALFEMTRKATQRRVSEKQNFEEEKQIDYEKEEEVHESI